MFKKNKKIIIVTTLASIILLLIVLILLYLPFFDLKKSIYKDRYSQSYLKDASVKNIDWNPIDTRIVTVYEGNGQVLVIYETYKRKDLLSYEDIPKDVKTVYLKSDKYDVSKALDLVSKTDLTKENPDFDNIVSPDVPNPKLMEEQKERQKPEECQKLLTVDKDFKVSDLNFVNKTTTFKDFMDKDFRGEILKNNYSIKIEKNNVLKIVFYFDKPLFNGDFEYTAKVTSAQKVFSDCSTEQIPLPEKP